MGGRFVPRRPLGLGPDALAKMATRSISAAEVQAIVADDGISDATLLISDEQDQDHGWASGAIRAITDDGELLRALTLDPARDDQPRGVRPGPKPPKHET